jgi:hypothetical protein
MRHLTTLGSVLAAGTVASFLMVAAPSFAAAPVELQSSGGDPVPRCISNGEGEGEELATMRTACDVLAFLNGNSHGFIRPCNASDGDCSADANGDACASGEGLWLCFGVGTAP